MGQFYVQAGTCIEPILLCQQRGVFKFAREWVVACQALNNYSHIIMRPIKGGDGRLKAAEGFGFSHVTCLNVILAEIEFTFTTTYDVNDCPNKKIS